MSFMDDALAGIPLPRVVKVRQHFIREYIEDIPVYVRRELSGLAAYQSIKSGQSIAVTGGSRGVNKIAEITREVCAMIKEKGAFPFVVPAMGSHGGATAEGQIEVLATYGITEESVGAPIKSSMEVVEIAEIADGRKVYLDKYASAADGIVLVNRIKAHTSFKGPYESGLMKMMAIGLGKQHGASVYHKTGFGQMPRIVEEVGNKVLQNAKILFGVGTMENGFGKCCKIAFLEAADIPSQEKELLKESYTHLARTFWKQCDVFVVTEIGKEITGTGLDPNVTGRFNTEFFKNDISVSKIGLLDLTAASHGNAAGVGFGDVIAKRLYDKIDLDMMYPNVFTSTVIKTANIPMVLKNDRQVIQALVKTANVLYDEKLRLSIVKNTKDMGIIYVSENMVGEAREKGCDILSEPMDILFDVDNALALSFID